MKCLWSGLFFGSVVLVGIVTLTVNAAFVIPTTSSSSRRRTPIIALRSPPSTGSTRNHDDASSSSLRMSSSSSADPTGELVRTLARIDRLQRLDDSSGRRNEKKRTSRWKKLVLPKDKDEDDDNKKDEEDFDSSSSSSTKFLTDIQQQVDEQLLQDYVYMLEPSSGTIPSCTIVFLGGAGLGQFPQVAYNEFLSRISDQLNAAILTAPYQVGLDHFTLSKETGERLRRALVQLQKDDPLQYPIEQPIYALGHSLGCKLHTIYLGAVERAIEIYNGIGFIAFNNYGFSQTIGMARSFAKELQKPKEGEGKDDDDDDDSNNDGNKDGSTSSSSSFGGGDTSQFLNQMFDFAELAVGSLGIEFSPSPMDTKRIIEMKFDEDMISKIRLFILEEDTLDSTSDFVESCRKNNMKRNPDDTSRPTISMVPGNHLTPVYVKLDVSDLDLDEMTKEMANEMTQGFQSISFGNEGDLQDLVEETCNFILGKPPTKSTSIPSLEGNIGRRSN